MPTEVSPEIFEDLVYYFKYASSAYVPVCPKPNGNVLVFTFGNLLSDVQGFIARDDRKKELVVALRGSVSVTDILIDASVTLVPLVCYGVTPPAGTQVHAGFLAGWTSVALQVIAIVKLQLQSRIGCSLVVVGHSMGGAIASLAAIALKHNFPTSKVRLFTYGQPRTGNRTFAEFINAELGSNVFRAVHGDDGIPTIIPTSLGYSHHGVEYWQTGDPSPNSTVQCDPSGEDLACSASVPSRGWTTSHTEYFGIRVGTPFCMSEHAFPFESETRIEGTDKITDRH